MNQIKIDEFDIQAYVDGQIEPGSHQARQVEAWLRAHPDAQARVERDLAVNASIKAALIPVFEAPVPDRLDPVAIAARIRRERHLNRGRVRRRGLAVAASVVVGLSGVMLLNSDHDDPLRAFADQVDRHAFGSGDGAALQVLNVSSLPTDWPDLAGIGLELEALHQLDESGHYFEVVYRDVNDHQVRMFVGEPALVAASEIRERGRGEQRLVYWERDGRRFALTGALPPEQLDQVAVTAAEQRVREQIFAGRGDSMSAASGTPATAPSSASSTASRTSAPVGGETMPASNGPGSSSEMSPRSLQELELLDMPL